MMSFASYLRKEVRMAILRSLAELPLFRANSSVLASILDQLGHSATRDQIKTELRWLEEQGLLAIDDVGSVLVATLTERGQDVAEGRAFVDGIARPRA